MLNAKQKPLVKLPPLQYFQHKVKLAPAARELYDEIADILRKRVEKIIKAEKGGIQLTEIRESLLILFLNDDDRN
jgi:methionine synthase II (cobalamin-independent)